MAYSLRRLSPSLPIIAPVRRVLADDGYAILSRVKENVEFCYHRHGKLVKEMENGNTRERPLNIPLT